MKYIIAFVLLGLVTYAGVFLLVSELTRQADITRRSVSLSSVSPQQYVSGMNVNEKLDRQLGKILTAETKRKVFDIEFGEPLVQHYYVIPAGKVLSPPEQYYMLICVTDDEDIKALDALYSEKLRPVGSVTPFECSGVLAEMDPPFVDKIISYLVHNPQLIKDEELMDMIGDTALVTPTLINGYNHVCQYVFYVQNNNGSEIQLIVTGAALTAVGAGGIVLLAIKKHRESTGY